MSRDITDDAKDAIEAPHVRAIVFVELDFEEGVLRVCNANYTFTWDEKEWLGVGYLGKISTITEEASLAAAGTEMELSGIPTELVSTAVGQHYQGKNCKIWFAPLDENYQPIANPIMIFWGRMDKMPIKLGKQAIIKLTAENRLKDWDRPRILRYNHEDQQALYPGDMGFEFVEEMVEKQLVWGRA